MEELGNGDAGPGQGREVAVADRSAAVGRRSDRGLALTPAEKAARRRNRRWMVGIAGVSIALLVLALIASAVAESNSPSGPAVVAPPGYTAARDGYFSYVVPTSWKIDQSQTDATGDIYRAGPSGFAAEAIRYRARPPVLGEKPPSSLEAFSVPRPQPYQLTDGRPTSVPGASTAFAYTLTRPGFTASVIDAWDIRSGVEIWLEVGAPPAVTTIVVTSLRG